MRLVFLALVVAALPVTGRTATSPQTDRKAQLQAALDEWRASVQSPGASLGVVAKDGQALGLASGVADRASGRAMNPDDLLMTGSTGKTFFAAVALQLVEGGR